MDDNEFKAFMDLLMCSDTWPIDPDTDTRADRDSQKLLEAYANKEAKKRGFSDWIEATHKM